MIKKIILSLFISLLSLSFLCSAEVVNKVLAVVGDATILVSEYEEIITPIIAQYKQSYGASFGKEEEKKLREDVLAQMINEKLFLQEGKRQKITASKRKQELMYEDIKKKFKSEEELKSELAKQNLSLEKLKAQIEEQVIMMELLNKEVNEKALKPTEEDAKKYYQSNLDKMVEPEAVRVRHILIKIGDGVSDKEADKKIKDIKKMLDKGANFAELAKKYSQDSATASKGGDLGLFVRGQMVKEFENTAFGLNVGQTSSIIKTQYGYHILRCEEKRLEQKKTFDEVKDYILNYLTQKNREKAYLDFIAKLRKTTNIKINQ